MLRALLVLFLSLAPAIALAGGDQTIAVLYFHNQGNPELEPLKVGLAQMLITDLQGTEGVTVVERSQLQAVLDEQQLGHSGFVDKDSAARIGKLLGADAILMGGYFELAGTLRIDARLVKVETGEILHAKGEHGITQQFMELEKALATDVGGFLAGTKPAPETKTPTKTKPAEQPPPTTRGGSGGTAPTDVVQYDADTVQAAVAYSEGLIFLDQKDTTRAREAFEKALVSDPKLAAARTELAALDL